MDFMEDLAPRLRNRVQLTTDGFPGFDYAVQNAFRGNIDDGMLNKTFKGEASVVEARRHDSPAPLAGTRPALVLSPASYNAQSGLMLCCPVTNQTKGYPFEVPVGPGANGNVTGVALADQVRCVDFVARRANKLGWVTVQCVLDVSSKAKTLLP